MKITLFTVFKKLNDWISFTVWIVKSLKHLYFFRIIALQLFLQNVVRRKMIAVKNSKKATVAKNAREGSNKIHLQILQR